MATTAVLDVGKTNVKLVLFEGGSVLWQKSTPNRPLPGPPYPHADVEAIWSFFIEGLREAAARFAITDVVVTTHGATSVLIDDAGLALPVMDYEFAGVDEIEAEYAAFRPPFAETLSPPISAGLNFGRQVFYQQRRYPEAFARARWLLMYPQYFVWRLTGTVRNEVTSLGCHGDLWNPAAGIPSSLVARCGWEHLLPPVVRAWDVVGSLSATVQAQTGLSADVRVRAGIHDSNASILPHLLTLEPPFTLVSTGTWVVIMALGASTARLDPARDMLAYVDARGEALPAAKFMGGREFATLLEGASSACDEEDVTALFASGALALPSFVANGGPFPGVPGRVVGALPQRPGARAALASLYAVLVTDYLLTKLGADAGAVVVEGSFAGNDVFCSALAALRPGQAVLLSPDTAGTAYGAGLLATWPQAPTRPPMKQARPLADAEGLLAYRERWREALPST